MSLTLHLTRDSVAAGDDVDAPHEMALLVADEATTEEMIAAIQAAEYLPRIASGRATWSVFSERTLAVIAQQWPEPRMVSDGPHPPGQLQQDGSGYRFHVKYHAQQDPETVLAMMRKVQASTN
jgi:hypothetical protein